MAVGTIVKQFDTLPPLARQLRHDPCSWKVEGEPVDLECAERVEWWFRHEETCQVIGGIEAVVEGDPGVSWVPLLDWMTARPGLLAIDIKVIYDDDHVQTWPAVADNPHCYVEVRRSVEVPDAIAIPVIATVKNEHDQGATLPSVETVELFTLTAQDGVNVPGIYRWDGAAYVLAASVSSAAAGIEVTPSATLPATYVTELVNLTATDGVNLPGLYRWDGAAYVSTGSTGADTDSYLHTQAAPTLVWTVVHNLGYEPGGIHIEDSAGNDMNGNVQHISVNQLTITFAVAVAGTARVG